MGKCSVKQATDDLNNGLIVWYSDAFLQPFFVQIPDHLNATLVWYSDPIGIYLCIWYPGLPSTY